MSMKEEYIKEYREEQKKKANRTIEDISYFFAGLIYFSSGLMTIILTSFFLGGFMALDYEVTSKGMLIIAVFVFAGIGSLSTGATLFEKKPLGRNNE